MTETQRHLQNLSDQKIGLGKLSKLFNCKVVFLQLLKSNAINTQPDRWECKLMKGEVREYLEGKIRALSEGTCERTAGGTFDTARLLPKEMFR